MSARKRALGRGLDALLGSEEKIEVTPEDHQRVRMIPFVRLRPNPYQPRHRFADETLDELTASIQANGILQPLVVRQREDGFEIVAGERRWRAAQRAGLENVPVIVRDFNDQEMLELSLIENIQRENLNAIDEARAYRQLIDEFELTQEAVAERVGKSRVTVTNTLRLLKLHETVQAWIEEGRLSAGHARCLLALESEAAQLALAREVMNKQWSVRETERQARRLLKGDPGDAVPAGGAASPSEGNGSRNANTQDLEEKLSMALGRKVRIHTLANDQGRVEIYYASLDEFQALLDRLGIPVEQEI
jgi:ParB family chromosome partitioning protein